MSARVLFLCTGNYYRSRFAELLFNHLAEQSGLTARADSAGLARQCRLRNQGAISPHLTQTLRRLELSAGDPPRDPRDVTDEDLARANVIIALKETEHRPMVEERLAPDVAARIRYWNVDDVEDLAPARALPQIERLVRELIEELR